jgi:hypothetical protein
MGDKSPKANLKKKAQQKGESQQRGSEERATGVSRQGGVGKAVGGANRREVWPAFQRLKLVDSLAPFRVLVAP